MAQKMPAVRLVQIGLVLEIAGLALLGLLARDDAGWFVIAIGLFLYGTDVGFATAQVTNVVLADVPPRKAGQGSGIQSAARQLGSALGIAILTSMFFGLLGSDTADRLKAVGATAVDADRTAGAVADSAGAAIAGLAGDAATESAANAARGAMTYAVRINSYTCAVLLLLGLLATFLIPGRPSTPSRTASAEPAPAGSGDAVETTG